ncbi:MAG: arginine deiminase family protein [Desulfomonilaceae bacterium]|nr:arginine deiminase family protein [Desulfomonilaceae bacterium]
MEKSRIEVGGLHAQQIMAPSLTVLTGISEFAARPEAVIVHDPVESGGLHALTEVPGHVDLEEELLFRSIPSSRDYARQYQAFVSALRGNGSEVLRLRDIIGDHAAYEAVAGNPNQVFTRDSLMTLPWVPEGYIAGRMKPQLRRSETTAMEVAANRLGLKEIIRVPDGLFLEGGDFVPFSREGRRTLLLGYGRRTCLETAHFLQRTLIPTYLDEIIALSLASRRINLDGGLLPVAPNVVIADRESILHGTLLDEGGGRPFDIWAMFDSLGMTVIDTTAEESVYFQSCNCVCLGNGSIIYYDMCGRVRDRLIAHGVTVHSIEGSELVKGRGGPRCMSRPIYCPVKVTPRSTQRPL